MARKPKPIGRLVVVEGPDGVGKSTVCRHLVDRLRAAGIAADLFSFPGRDPGTLGELIYRLHHDAKSVGLKSVSPLANQAMHIAAHIDAIDRLIRAPLERGRVVILDRYWWSAWVHGLVAGCERRRLRALIEAERAAWGAIRPALAVLLRRATPIDRDESPVHWRDLVREYERLVDREQSNHPIETIENLVTADDTAGEIVARLSLMGITREPQNIKAAQLTIGFLSAKGDGNGSPQVLTHILPARPSVAYDTYWKFAAERQEIFFKRVEGMLPPWTEDEILSKYKFTSAYRASDRVSQYLIRRVIYRDDLSGTADEVFFRLMLFKFFNKIETWEAIEAEVGPIVFKDYSFKRYDKVLTRAMDAGNAIYSAAYIMPSVGGALGHDRKHRNHLSLLERMMADSLPQRLADAASMQCAFELLKSYPSLGDFLAYQYVTDVNYSEITDFSENEFVVPGPGALDGIRKVFMNTGGLNEPEIIKFMAERQDHEFARLGIPFRSLWGRPLQLIDCQNLFCEVDKYSRVRHPDLVGISGRLRIKQKFQEKANFPTPWYPPKWRINEIISRSLAPDVERSSRAPISLAAESFRG